MHKPKLEYSKKIVFWSGIIFLSQVILANIFSWLMKDVSIFSYSIPTSGTIFAAAVGFYLNKAKIENVCKGKIKFFQFKMEYLDRHPERQHLIEDELSAIDDALDAKMNSTIEESIAEDIDIQP